MMVTAEFLLESSEQYRSDALEALAVPEIQRRIEIRKAKRLQKLAKGAGTLLLQNDGKLTKKWSRNSLYIIPTSTNIQEGTTLNCSVGKSKLTIPIGKIVQLDTPCHVSMAGIKNKQFIVLPTEIMNQMSLAERAALLVHELTHADQFDRNAGWKNSSTAQEETRDEAEAYNNQFIIINHYWDGLLDELAEANVGNENAYDIKTLDSKQRLALLQSSVATHALAAVTRNLTHNYPADGILLPDPGLVTDYQQLDLINSDKITL